MSIQEFGGWRDSAVRPGRCNVATWKACRMVALDELDALAETNDLEARRGRR
jgi:hypothetical protein